MNPTKISDERLKELIAHIPIDAMWGVMDSGKNYSVNVHNTLIELQTSRQTIKRLVDLGNDLALTVKDEWGWGGEVHQEGWKKWDALMQELNAEDTTHRVLRENMEAWEELGKDKEEK